MARISTIILLTISMMSVQLKAQVPAQWDTAKVQLTTKLNQGNTTIQSLWDNQPYCTDFASNLILAKQ